ncbi:sentrin-specific protease 7-like [Contarinia nasturtii]|uniref:sentrin-specific protease 7-like n=1 Tax=Contarinia nasturtii TaxID=265458 RepID=UPI0012D3F918|nr:sentrin-specific protease 7-like [Contarinia nasturtii]
MDVEFAPQCIYIGSNKVKPKGNIQFTTKEIRMVLQDSTTKSIESIQIPINFVVKCIYHMEIKIILMIYVRPTYGQMVCERMHIKPATHSENPYNNVLIMETESSDAVCKAIKELFYFCDEISHDEIEKMTNKIKSRKRKISDRDPDNCLQYPPTGSGRLSIYVNDYASLACDEYLNDNIVNYYIRYLTCEVLTDEQKKVTHIFDSFFYQVLTNTPSTDRKNSKKEKLARLDRWTKNINIFDMDFIVVPINQSKHWYLAIICFAGLGEANAKSTVKYGKRRKTSNGGTESDTDESSTEIVKKPCILIFDSLSGGRYKETTVLREFLNLEYKKKVNSDGTFKFDSINIPGHVVKVPRQENTSDCGLFMLHYIEQFFTTSAIKKFEFPIKNLENWFEPSAAARKRRDIADLIKRHMSDDIENSFSMINLPDIQLPS